jgi:hypothetical protein
MIDTPVSPTGRYWHLPGTLNPTPLDAPLNRGKTEMSAAFRGRGSRPLNFKIDIPPKSPVPAVRRSCFLLPVNCIIRDYGQTTRHPPH